jgi:hypothetical protein
MSLGMFTNKKVLTPSQAGAIMETINREVYIRIWRGELSAVLERMPDIP